MKCGECKDDFEHIGALRKHLLASGHKGKKKKPEPEVDDEAEDEEEIEEGELIETPMDESPEKSEIFDHVTGAKIKLYRDEPEEYAGFLKSYARKIDFDEIKKEYGGGTFRAEIRKNGKYVRSSTFRIVGEPIFIEKLPAPEEAFSDEDDDAGFDDFEQMNRTLAKSQKIEMGNVLIDRYKIDNEKRRAEIEKVKAEAQAIREGKFPSREKTDGLSMKDMFQMQQQTITMMSAMQGKKENIKDVLETYRAIKELSGDSDNKVGSTPWDIVKDAVKEFAPEIKEGLKVRNAAIRQKVGGQVVQTSAGQQVQASNVQSKVTFIESIIENANIEVMKLAILTNQGVLQDEGIRKALDVLPVEDVVKITELDADKVLELLSKRQDVKGKELYAVLNNEASKKWIDTNLENIEQYLIALGKLSPSGDEDVG